MNTTNTTNTMNQRTHGHNGYNRHKANVQSDPMKAAEGIPPETAYEQYEWRAVSLLPLGCELRCCLDRRVFLAPFLHQLCKAAIPFRGGSALHIKSQGRYHYDKRKQNQ